MRNVASNHKSKGLTHFVQALLMKPAFNIPHLLHDWGATTRPSSRKAFAITKEASVGVAIRLLLIIFVVMKGLDVG